MLATPFVLSVLLYFYLLTILFTKLNRQNLAEKVKQFGYNLFGMYIVVPINPFCYTMFECENIYFHTRKFAPILLQRKRKEKKNKERKTNQSYKLLLR